MSNRIAAYSSWPPSGGKMSGDGRDKRSIVFKNAEQETTFKTIGPYSVRLIDRGAVMEMFSHLPALDMQRFLAEQYPQVTMSPLSDEMVGLLMGETPTSAPD